MKWPVVSGSDGAKRRIFTQHDADEVNALLMERHAWVLKRPKCPHGRAGDVLWVREAWRPEELPSGLDGVRYRADDAFREIENTPEAADAWGAVYRPRGCVWRSSIHMPRWASRLTLEVESVSVERLQDITRSDAIAEGLKQVGETFGMPLWDFRSLGPHAGYGSSTDPTEAFQHVWDSINGKRPGCAWADSPWVWRIAFRRVKP